MIYLDNLVDTQPRKLNTMCKRMHLDVKASSTRLPPYTHRLVHALREDRRQGRSPLIIYVSDIQTAMEVVR